MKNMLHNLIRVSFIWLHRTVDQQMGQCFI